MDMPKLNQQEKKRVREIDESLGWRFSVSIKDHFNKAGKMQDFAATPTKAEIAEQTQAMRELVKSMFDETKSSWCSLKTLDIFLGAARRLEDDAVLATHLPAGKFKATDVPLLEKSELKSLAALVKQQTTPKP